MSIRFSAILIFCALSLGFGVSAYPCHAATASPAFTVEAFQKQLISAMKNARRLSVEERYSQLKPSIEDAFFFPIMTQIAVGSYWDKATDAQKRELVRAFKRTNISTAATLFNGYSGQRFKTEGVVDGPQQTRLVETHLVNPDGSAIKMVYRMLTVQNSWRIIDVIIDDGISEVQVRKSEYSRILQKNGIDGLTRILNDKADELLEEE